jgi:hypothetical protein
VKGLGRIQRGALAMLASRPDGCGTTDLAHLTDRKGAWNTLNALAGRGLAEPAGKRPNGSADGRGKPLGVYVITDAGRQLQQTLGNGAS